MFRLSRGRLPIWHRRFRVHVGFNITMFIVGIICIVPFSKLYHEVVLCIDATFLFPSSTLFIMEAEPSTCVPKMLGSKSPALDDSYAGTPLLFSDIPADDSGDESYDDRPKMNPNPPVPDDQPLPRKSRGEFNPSYSLNRLCALEALPLTLQLPSYME